MNEVTFLGRLTTDPVSRYTQDGKQVFTFSFAVNRKFHRENEPEADFFNCVVFGKTAERFAKCQIRKGTRMILKAEARNNNYTDSKGVKRYEIQFSVYDFFFAGSREGSEPEQAQKQAPVQEPQQDFVPEEYESDDDMPF